MLVSVLGVALSVAVAWFVHARLASDAAHLFDRYAYDLNAAIGRRIHGDLEVLAYTRDLCSSQGVQSQDQFDRFAAQVLARHSALRSLHYAPRLEAQMLDAGEPHGAQVPVDESPRLDLLGATYVVRYSYSLEPGAKLKGYGLRAFPPLSEAVDKASAGDGLVATGPISGLGEPERGASIGVLLPVEPRPEADGAKGPAGFVLGTYNLRELIAASVEGLRFSDLDLYVVDRTGGASGIGLYATPNAGLLDEFGLEHRLASGDSYQARMQIAGRDWELNYLSRRPHGPTDRWLPWGALLASLCVTGLLAAYLHSVLERSERVQRLVRRRTHQLSSANRQLAEEVRARKRTEKRLRLLIATLSRQGLSSAQRIGELLDFGAGELGLSLGCVARVEGLTTSLTHVFDPRGELQPGSQWPTERTLAGETLRRGQPLALHDLSASPWRAHPVHREHNVGALICCPIRVGGQDYGVVAFADPEARSQPFQRMDTNLLQLLANSIGQEIQTAAMAEQLEHQASHDPLTQLPNRTLLRDRLEQALSSARRHGDRVGVLYFDLDGFKSVNDEYGHDTGDWLLRLVAERLHPLLRAEDTLARVGGDEFVVLLPRLGDVHGAETAARKLLIALRTPFVEGARDVRVSASIGIALAPEHESSALGLISKADAAMYAAKQAGGDCHRTAEPARRLRGPAAIRMLERFG